MNTPQSSKPAGWFSTRTRLITAVSIVVVGLAGATAVGANVGILDASTKSDVGTVSAAGDLTPADTQVIDVYLPGETTSTVPATVAPPSAAGIQEFSVDAAGTVAVAATANGLRLDSVTPQSGWTWSLAQTDQQRLMVTMTNGVRTLEFAATTTADGNISANVNEPIVNQAPPVANGSGHAGEGDSEYEGGEDDD